MRPSTRAAFASLLFAVAIVIAAVQGKDDQVLTGAVIVTILISASWVCEAIEKGPKS